MKTLLITLLISVCFAAHAEEKIEYLNKEDIELIKKQFVTTGCAIDFVTSPPEYIHQCNQDCIGMTQKEINKLPKEDLCLISRLPFNNLRYYDSKGNEQVLLSNKSIKPHIKTFRVIYMPSRSAYIKCGDDPLESTFPYAVSFTKKDGKIQRTIQEDMPPDCYIKQLKIKKDDLKID